jgi:hypothetical protein
VTNTAELSVDIMCHITRALNTIVQTQGSIQINNKTIWGKFLHQMDNVVWRGILETLQQLYHQQPELFELHQITAINNAAETLNQYYNYYDNVLHINRAEMRHRTIAWRALMVMREVVNQSWK